ncbi:hypothetical protein [Ferrimonas gelatinilytica]|uniref:hypothetical protein n=1 Tax=Ferrimonas gelatinilytica TaxID=1255257 RepID=UPI0031E893F4
MNRGRRIDFESDLGLEKSRFSPMLELSYRFNDNHLLALNALTLHRSAATREVIRGFEFDWEGQTYRAQSDARVSSRLDIDIYQLFYGYSLWRSEDLLLVGTLGMHVMDIKAQMSGELSLVSDNLDIANVREAEETLTAPLPDLGLMGYWQITPRWEAVLSAQYFQLKVDDYKGRLIDLRAQVNRAITDRFDIGIAWQYYRLTVDHERAASGIDLRFSYQGPTLLFQYRFF